MSSKIYTRSVSQLLRYSDCSERFFLERIKKVAVPDKPAAWTLRGKAVHAAIEAWEASWRQIDIIDYGILEYNALLQEAVVATPDYKDWQKTPRVKTVEKDILLREEDVERQLEWYLRWARGTNWEIWELPDQTAAVEVPFEFSIGDVSVKGFIDQIVVVDDHFEIRDIKTGKERTGKTQLGVYAFFASKIFGVDIRYGKYVYPKLSREGDLYNLSNFDDLLLKRLFSRLDRAIDEGIFLPNESDHCGTCPVRRYCSVQGWETP